MKRDLAMIDALGLIHENIKIIVKCITLEDIDREEMRVLAYIADNYLNQMSGVLYSSTKPE